MKRSELKQIIKEEVQKALNENTPKYKKGDKLTYMGTAYTVSDDDGYVVKVVSDKGKESMINYNQLSKGVHKPVREIAVDEPTKEYTFEYAYWWGNPDEDYDYDQVTVTASSEEEAREKALNKARGEHSLIRSSKDRFELISVK